MKDHTRTLSQMRNLCKLLFPEESIGLTMVRLLELLAGTWENEVYYENLVQVPPNKHVFVGHALCFYSMSTS